jgi:hypothetical protein
MSNVALLAIVRVPPEVVRFAVLVPRLRIPPWIFKSSAIVKLALGALIPVPEIFRILYEGVAEIVCVLFELDAYSTVVPAEMFRVAKPGNVVFAAPPILKVPEVRLSVPVEVI